MKKQCFSLILAALLPMSINVLTSCTSKTKEKEKEKEEEEEKFEPKVYDLPCFYVNTENKAPITSKEEYVKCTTTINNTKSEYKLSNSSGKIRGRGNSTWKQEKKPYKLKFDESTDLFGNGSAKTWTLIANHFDPTLIKNYLAYSVCNEFASQPYTTSLEFVDLYLNNEYQGVYAVCEQIEAHKNRVNIKTSWGEPQDMNYLIELDNRLRLEHETGLNIFSSESNYYKIHYPDVEDTEYTQDFTDYVKNYFQDCYTAVNGKDWATISNLVDIESCADTYIMHEFFKNSDAGFSSFYMYIHHVSGEPKLTFGPLWDFDLTADFNNRSYEQITVAGRNIWFKKMFEFHEFKQVVKEELAKYKSTIISTINEKVSKILAIPSCFEQNFKKWEKVIKYTDWKDKVKNTKQWLLSSLDYVYNFYNE